MVQVSGLGSFVSRRDRAVGISIQSLIEIKIPIDKI